MRCSSGRLNTCTPDALDHRRGNDDPFFLCVSFHCPHDPFKVPQDLWDLYEGAEIEIPQYPANMEETYSAMDRWLNAYHGTDRIDIRSPESLTALRRSYYGLVTWIDRKVGELVEALDRLELSDNTIVLFTSDHGDMLAEKNMVQKRSFYEFSSRVPMIVRFPDGWKAGTTCPQPVSLIDLAPTIDGVGGRSTEWTAQMDGRSLLPCIEGGEMDRVAFSESHTNGVYEPCFMARKGKFKYIYIRNEEGQLFDLEADPGEWNNLCGDPAYAEVEAELRAHVLETFDPDAVERELQVSLERRALLGRPTWPTICTGTILPFSTLPSNTVVSARIREMAQSFQFFYLPLIPSSANTCCST